MTERRKTIFHSVIEIDNIILDEYERLTNKQLKQSGSKFNHTDFGDEYSTFFYFEPDGRIKLNTSYSDHEENSSVDVEIEIKKDFLSHGSVKHKFLQFFGGKSYEINTEDIKAFIVACLSYLKKDK